MKTVILVPVLRRPQNIIPFLTSVAAATPELHRVVFICNSDDTAERELLHDMNLNYLQIGPWAPGDYARKINYGYRNTDEPLLFLAADDLRFGDGWLGMAQGYLSDQIQVVGTNDLGNPRVMAGYHSTHTLVTRSYVDTYGTIDRPRTVLTEQYPHCFTDDEFVQTAIARRMFAHAPDAIVEHLHPNWNKSAWDDVYSIADQSIRPGRRIFQQRRRMWHRDYLRYRQIQPGHQVLR